MPDPCPNCGLDRVLVGYRHNCRPRPKTVAAKKPQARLAEAARKPGRPRIEDRDKTLAATKPWLALGMSERTWYRRQAEARKGKRES